MKILFTGLGSIGTRHLRNLHTAAKGMGIKPEVWALRSSDRPLPDDVRALVAREVRALPEDARFDAAFITNPTSLHFETLRALRGRVETLFIEKPVFDDPSLRLADCLEPGQKAYIAAPMRWCGVMQALKRRLPQLRVYSARVICSSYLPEWRPGVDYRTVYSARRELGGGVAIDLIHEWDYLVELFGIPEEIHCLRGTYSDLEIDSDDLAVYIAKYPTLLAEVHLDYFGRAYRRAIELFGPDGTVTADFGEGTLTLADGSCESFVEPVNARYMREMAYFLEYARGERVDSLNPPETALAVLKLTLGENV